jgi:hypothetical protein
MMDELPRGPDEARVSEADIAAIRKFPNDLAATIRLADPIKADKPSAERRPHVEQTNETGVRGEERDANGDFPIIGTPEWGRMNQRRAELIRKKNRKGLSPEELVEYERLQRLSHEALEAHFPRPSAPLDPDGSR